MPVRVLAFVVVPALLVVVGCTGVESPSKACALGTTWSTVDDFRPGSGTDSSLAEGAAGGAGGVIVVGGSGEVSGTNTWFVRRSSDGGKTWTTVETISSGDDQVLFSNGAKNFFAAGSTPYWDVRSSADGALSWAASDAVPPSGGLGSEPFGGTVDVFGTAYVVGNQGFPTASDWFVRRRTSGGSWTTVDDVASVGGVYATGTAVASQGTLVLVAGYDVQVSNQVWLVRQSADGGTTWAGTENFLPTSTYSNCAPTGIAVRSDGRAIAVGSCIDLTMTKRFWITRVSSDGGTTWTTGGDLAETYDNASASTVLFAADGTAYAAGGYSSGTTHTWTVQKSTDGGVTWKTVDNFRGTSDGDASARALAFDGSGSLYAVGSVGATSSDPDYWLVRKLPCE